MSAIAKRALPPLPPGQVERPVERPVEKPVPVKYVDFLLPTGILITITQVSTTETLRQLKDKLFREAKGYPLYSLLKDQGFYNFLGKLLWLACIYYKLICFFLSCQQEFLKMVKKRSM